MPTSYGRSSAAAQRFRQRRQREDAAERLRARIPWLFDLRIDVEERRAESKVPDATYIRRIVVEHAPALFVLPCGDRSCKDGGHDVTVAILRALDRRERVFEGESMCLGTVGTASCGRMLHFKATATYR